MSGRLLASPRNAATPAFWARLVRSKMVWSLGIVAGALIAAWVAFPGGGPAAAPPPPQQAMPAIPYDPAAPPPPPQVRELGQPPATNAPPPPPRADAPPRPALVMSSFGGGNFVPEYMKPAQVAAQAETKRAGIRYQDPGLDAIHSMTIQDRTYELPAFSTFPCVMETKVITGASGITPFRCHIMGNVLSPPPARVTLFDDGTTVGGYYKSVATEGQNRVNMVTAQAETPYGVTVIFADPVADSLGAAGVPGSVDNHWGPRIGGALLLALADATISLGEAALQNAGHGNQTFNFGGGQGISGIGQVTNSILGKTINIPPTISLNQGDIVMLWTTRMIDFSPSYRVETR